MGRRRSKPDAVITSERGNIYVDGSTYDVEFRYPFWLFKINQGVLLPGFRRDHCKVIYLNGKRYGRADYREGAIPLKEYRVPEEYWSDHVTNVMREFTGLGCSRSARGYYNIRLKSRTYVAVVRRTSDGYLRCIVHCRDNGRYIGDFLFDANVEKVYPRLSARGLERTFSIIIGYIMDCLVYTTVSIKLERKLEIKY